jgi:hypothetical protein
MQAEQSGRFAGAAQRVVEHVEKYVAAFVDEIEPQHRHGLQNALTQSGEMRSADE